MEDLQSSPYHASKQFLLKIDSPTYIVESNGLPTEYKLFQNYPNPFNPATTIVYELPEHSNVVLKIFDVLGNEIEKLVDEHKPAGRHSVNYDAGNLASGVYYYQLITDKKVITNKFVLIK